MANGKVLTGFSKPYVAKYSAKNGEVSYTDGMPMARGVDVSLDITASDTDPFFADNVQAEADNQAFSSGTASVTVDGLKQAARRLLSGVATKESVTVGESTVNFDVNDDDQIVPYVGFGFIAMYMEDGVTTYVPYILTKTKFDVEGLEAKTKEKNIEWQTQALSADIYRDDTPKHRWKMIGDDLTTEEEAYAAIVAVLGPKEAGDDPDAGAGE